MVESRLRGEIPGRRWRRWEGRGGKRDEVEAVHFLLPSHLKVKNI